MRKIVVCTALAMLLALGGGQAFAEICTIDDVPAATLLLPYFEVNLNNPNDLTTLFSINNASAAPTIAHVTLWSDLSVPTLDFDIYLTGYDVQTINLRDVFAGFLPITADDGVDTSDTISPQGALSGDLNFPGASGPCVTTYGSPHLDSTFRAHLRACHTGDGNSPIYGGCCGLDYGDGIARGYITVDNAVQCSLEFPSAGATYFTNTASNVNQLWGDYFYVDVANAFAQGETLVHIEACPDPSVGNGAGRCDFTAGDYTFYGRYVGFLGTDQREPLSTTWATRFATSATDFDGGTDLLVWRDPRDPDADAGSTCAPGDPAFNWFPMNQADAVAFDEEENPFDLCFVGSDVSPPIGGAQTCFPAETGRYNVEQSIVPFSQSLDPPPAVGWLYLNLNTTAAITNQSWVTTVMSALGQFSVGFDAITLQTACDEIAGGVILIP